MWDIINLLLHHLIHPLNPLLIKDIILLHRPLQAHCISIIIQGTTSLILLLHHHIRFLLPLQNSKVSYFTWITYDKYNSSAYYVLWHYSLIYHFNAFIQVQCLHRHQLKQGGKDTMLLHPYIQVPKHWVFGVLFHLSSAIETWFFNSNTIPICQGLQLPHLIYLSLHHQAMFHPLLLHL